MVERNSEHNLWTHDTSILFKNISKLNPIDRDQSSVERFNASARLLMIISGAAAIVTKQWKYLGYGAAVMIIMNIIIRQKMKYTSMTDKDFMGELISKQQPTPINYPSPPSYVSSYPIHNDVDHVPKFGYPPRQTSFTPVLYNLPLVNDQMGFGVHGSDASGSDRSSSFSQNQFNSELEDQLMNYPNINYRHSTTHNRNFLDTSLERDGFDNIIQVDKDTNGSDAVYGFRPNNKDPRCESYEGIVPHYDARAMMQMEPTETNLDTSTEYETRQLELHHQQRNPIYAPEQDHTKMRMPFNKITGRYESYPFDYENNVLINENNPYGNPNPYQFHEAARMKRTRQPNELDIHDMITEQSQRDMIKMYYGSSELDEGLFINPLPDPTNMARPVFFPESSEWDNHIVYNNARNQYLFQQ
jgi:hypothetical protein